ncbi:unnamed protein product, partial [Closterium sp. NIES-54]
DLPVLRLHSDRGDEFSSDLLRDFCRGEGILQSFTLPDSPQQNGIVERRIGLVMEVARTSMIHAAAPHFLWPFAVQYAAHQLNLWPRVSLLETSTTLRWTGKVGDASVFRFYHPTTRRVFPSQDVTFDESVPFYRLFPYRSDPPPPPPLFLAPGPPLVDPLPPQGLAPSGAAPSTASRGAASGGAGSVGAGSGGEELGGAGPEGAEFEGAESGGAGLGGAEPEGVEPGGTMSEVRSLGVLSRGVLLLLDVLRVLRHDSLLCRSLSPRSSCTSGLLSAPAFGVELPEQETVPLETLELEVLELLQELVVPEVMQLLVLEVLIPWVLKLPRLVVLGELELETLRSLEQLGPGELELLALVLEALAREALELEELELLTLELEELEALCGRDRTSFLC